MTQERLDEIKALLSEGKVTDAVTKGLMEDAIAEIERLQALVPKPKPRWVFTTSQGNIPA